MALAVKRCCSTDPQAALNWQPPSRKVDLLKFKRRSPESRPTWGFFINKLLKDVKMNSTYLVPFCHTELTLIDHGGEPYVAMKPVVEGMGLAWEPQFSKLKQRFNSVITEIVTTGKDGKQYNMICLPLKKLFGWLMTISPNKVKAELRNTIIRYQEECDEVLWQYWTKDVAHKHEVLAAIAALKKREAESFADGSKAGSGLAKRKYEKKFIQATIAQLEYELMQLRLI